MHFTVETRIQILYDTALLNLGSFVPVNLKKWFAFSSHKEQPWIPHSTPEKAPLPESIDRTSPLPRQISDPWCREVRDSSSYRLSQPPHRQDFLGSNRAEGHPDNCKHPTWRRRKLEKISWPTPNQLTSWYGMVIPQSLANFHMGYGGFLSHAGIPKSSKSLDHDLVLRQPWWRLGIPHDLRKPHYWALLTAII